MRIVGRVTTSSGLVKPDVSRSNRDLERGLFWADGMDKCQKFNRDFMNLMKWAIENKQPLWLEFESKVTADKKWLVSADDLLTITRRTTFSGFSWTPAGEILWRLYQDAKVLEDKYVRDWYESADTRIGGQG